MRPDMPRESAGFEAVAATPDDLAFGAGAIDATAPDLVRWGDGAYPVATFWMAKQRGDFLHRAPRCRERACVTPSARSNSEPETNANCIIVAATPDTAVCSQRIRATASRSRSSRTASNWRRCILRAKSTTCSHPGEPFIAKWRRRSPHRGNARSTYARAAGCKTSSASHIDRDGLTAEAAARYSATALREIATRLQRFGRLNSIALTEIDARYFGRSYSYRARFERAIVEYRFGLASDGKVWNLAVDRED